MALWVDTYGTVSDVNVILRNSDVYQSLDNADRGPAVVTATQQINDAIIPEGVEKTAGQPLKFPRVFDHALSIQYPELYTEAEQKRRFALATAAQVEYNLSRLPVGYKSYELDSETVQSDQQLVFYKVIQILSIYLKKLTQDWVL